MAILYWLRRPRMALARVRQSIWERRNPQMPWLCPGTIAFCQAHLSKSMNAFEFGSGRSTRWFSHLVGHLISIEHNAEWFTQVKQQLEAEKIGNVDYRLIPLNHPSEAGELHEYVPVPDYVAAVDELADRSLDFAVVDGHYRTCCVRHLVPKMAIGGYLLLDDADRWRSFSQLQLPATWRVVSDQSNGIKRCVSWQAE